MKKTFQRILALALCLMMCVSLLPIPAMAAATVAINESNFPDNVFRDYVSKKFDTDSNGVLSQSEIDAVRVIKLEHKYVSDLKGIEYFTGLKTLRCFRNQLKSLDVSKNTALTELDCSQNQLKSLDVSKNTALKTLDCSDNQLNSLDVSKNTSLTNLNCGYNPLKSLDVSKNTSLTELRCDDNQLKSLDVSKNTSLTVLYCNDNPLKSLDVSKNTGLETLYCSQNQLTSLDVSKSTALTYLYCSKNQLESLVMGKNTSLKSLDCSENQLKSLDVSKNTSLTSLWCSNNQLKSLDVSKNTSLTELDCSGNSIATLDLRSCADMANALKNKTKVEFHAYTHGCCIENDPYRVEVDYTTAVRLGGGDKPVITAQPKDRAAASGKKAVFTVKATGQGLSYRWFNLKKGETRWDALGTAASQSVTAWSGLDAAAFRCMIRNGDWIRFSKTAKLTVISKPKITTQPAAVSVKAGKTATFKIKATGTGLTYQWYYQKPGTTAWVKMSGKTKATLSFTAKASQNSYKYRCTVKNKAGSVNSKAVKLTVK